MVPEVASRQRYYEVQLLTGISSPFADPIQYVTIDWKLHRLQQN